MNQQGGFRQGGGKSAPGRGGGGKFQNSANRNQNPEVKGIVLSCPACNYTCASMQHLQVHFQRTNHKPAEGDHPPNGQQGNPSDPEPAPADAPLLMPDHVKRSMLFLKDFVDRADRESIIGLEYVLEYRLQSAPGRIDTKYFCEICDVDSNLATMMAHLTCYRHRKLYLMKVHPYVLKAPSNSKENRAQFMKRMAMEIEQEEGTKMYKMDPTIRMVPMMKPTESKQARQKTRWNSEGDRQRRMKKALEYLEAFEIDNDGEATTVTRLTEKLIAELKFHSDKLKDQALFPVKVARAMGVAMSITQNAPRGRMAPQDPGQKNPVHKVSPMFNKGPPEGRLSGPSQPNRDKHHWTPNAAFPDRRRDMENTPMDPMANPYQGPQAEQPPEESKFFTKLKSLLSVLPQNSASADNSQMKSKLLMLKSLLLDKKASQENVPGHQLMHGAPMAPDTANMDNLSVNQQMGQFGQNLMSQMSSMGDNAQMDQNSLIQLAALLQNSQMNANLLLPDNQNFQNADYMDMGNSAGMPMDPMAYQEPYVEQPLGLDNADFGFDGRMAGKFEDYAAKPAPYTRVTLSPSIQRSEEERHRDGGYRRDARRERRSEDARSGYGGRRSFDDPAWEEREKDTRYGKRAKLDGGRRRSRSSERRRRHEDSEAAGPNLSVDLLKRIRGKDLFTVSAILSEYSDSHSK